MLDFTEADVAAWFTPIRPPTRQNNWPPAIRALERGPNVAPLLHELGAVLSELGTQDPSILPKVLLGDPVPHDLQTVAAQLGAARLLRLVDWLSATLPGAPQLLAQLSQGRTANAQAINSALRALTARDTLTRMFSPDRVAWLQSCAEAATNPQENA
ncbi:hypothetical protein GCM10010909_12520 [Acidocella aquatica]|uniref:Uncharacterized protein n=1 Tax=Acidocella aquatica TaxID=1922313 RepID=A0ABQ6A4H1_9PROT|nr:hypothetical protein [Acidocella aquatica]GLR66572.1 hypothetical protein GCM10010909_12520 [Acidocella aquatica]